MGLYNNGYRLGNTPFKRSLGGLASIYNGGGTAFNYSLPVGAIRSYLWTFGKYAGLPTGNNHPESWILPQKSGYMSMRTVGSGAMAANLVPSYPMSIDMTGSGDLDATAALVISMLAAMTGSGDMSATITGRLNMSIDMEGSGDLEGQMTGIASMVVDMLGEGDLEATIAAYGDMSIDMVVTGTGLSTSNVGNAVWGALASSFEETGTMGALLKLASSGGIDMEALADAVLSALAGDLAKLDNIKERTDRIPQYPATDDDIPTAEENAEAVWRYTRD